MTEICPCCGFDLSEDKPIERAGLSMFPYGNVRFNGAEIRLTAAESAVLWALMKAGGRPLSRAVIAERIGYEGDGNCVDVLLTRVRHKLAAHGQMPIRNQRGVGVSIE